MLGSDSYSNEGYIKILHGFYFQTKEQKNKRKIYSFVLLPKTYPNLYDSAVSYDTFIIYSASIRFRPYRL